MNVKIKCNQCGNQIDVNSNSYNYQVPVTVNGKKLFITSIKCEKCDTLMIVQIDDYKSKQLLNESKKIIRNQLRKKQENKSSKNTEKYRKLQKHLSEIRTTLMKEYDGQIACDDCGNTFELRFVVV